MEPQTKTSFLGVTIDTENGSSDPQVIKALSKSFSLLDILEFMKVTKFKINKTMFDYFWQIVIGNQCRHVSTLVLEWFGYEGEYRAQKDAFLRILKRNNISYRELTRQDVEIEQYPTIQEELELLPHEGARSRAKFLIMEPDDLKMVIMQLKTKKGDTIRKYYIDLEKLLRLYTEYTLYFNHRDAKKQITDLQQSLKELNFVMVQQEEERQKDRELEAKERKKDRELLRKQEEERQKDREYLRSLGISLEEVKDQNEELLDKNEELLGKTKGLEKKANNIQRKLGIAVEDRAPQPEDESKRERFVLIKRNDPDYMTYHVIRAQDAYTKRKLKTEQLHFPDSKILLDFKCSPNSKTLYVRVKENLKEKGVVFKHNDIDLEDSKLTEEDLIEELKVINDAKRDV